MKLLRTFPKETFEFGLASWQWLGLREQTPRFATCFGDIFLESLDGWWFLDTVEGTLELRWTSAVTMYAELVSPEGRATYLMDDLVREARSRGIYLGDEDVYMFSPHPALGGELGVEGLGATRFELAVNWLGRVHDRVLHSSGEIHVPPLPDDSRRTTPPQVAAAWGSARSDDETFDVPFEQYLATTTFAAVATPALHGYGDRGYGGHGYSAAAHDALTAPAQPDTAAPWPAQTEPASSWPEQTEAAQAWPEPGATHQPGATYQPAAPQERYDGPYDLPYPAASHAAAPEPYGTGPVETQPEPRARQGWAPYDSEQDGGAHARADHGAEAWGRPTWGSTWGSQAPAVAAGSQQNASDPFTAWDDLWGRR